MELGDAIVLSTSILGFCSVLMLILLRFIPSKNMKNNPDSSNPNSNSKVSEKVFSEFRIGLERWMKGIDEKVGKIFNKLDDMKR